MTEFVERNMQMLRKKEWAKDLLYKGEGQTDELPLESEDEDDEDEESGAAVNRGAAGAAARPGAGGPLKTKTAADQPAGARPRVARPREPAAAANESSYSSCSESSQPKQQERQRKRRKKDDRKKMGGMLGYGDYFGRGQKDLHISPEVMMMNQYMGSMMMMNNPLYMGMGAGMMPGAMGMMAPGMKIPKKDDKTKKLKVDTKLKRDPHQRERERDRPPLRKEKEPEDPRLNKPVKPVPKPPAANAAKDAMIDAADL